MKHKIWILVIALICVIQSNAYGQVSRVVGAGADVSAPPLPSGVCSGTLNMTSEAVLSIAGGTTTSFSDIAPSENSFRGNIYLLMNMTSTDNNLFRIALDTMTVAGTTVTDVANNPDIGNSQVGSHYNTTTGRWVQTGLQGVAPCNVAVNDCLHIRTYNNGTVVSDVRPTIGQIISTVNRSTFDSTDTYIQYVQSTGVPGAYLGKFTTGSYAFSTSVLTNGAGTVFGGLTNDNTYVYGIMGATNQIHRFLKSNIAAGATVFTPGFAGVINSIVYGPALNVLYVTSTTNIMYRVDAVTMTITGSSAFGATEIPNTTLIDNANSKLYMGIAANTQGGNLNRLDRPTLVQEQAFGTLTSTNGPRNWMIDVRNQRAYIVMAMGGGLDTRVQKVRLCQ